MNNFISKTKFGDNYGLGQRSLPSENTPPFNDWIKKIIPKDVTGLQQGGHFSQAAAATKMRRE